MASDYAQLAQRISGTTSKCLLTAVVLIAGLGFGRQVLRWWREDESPSAAEELSARLADGLGDPAQLHTLQFGDQPWSLRRQSLTGSKDQATAALRTSCRDVLQESAAAGSLAAERSEAPEPAESGPQDSWGTAALCPSHPAAPGKAEGDFLRRLAATKPAEQEPGKWRLYDLNETFPMVAGTVPAVTREEDDPQQPLASAATRLATWGLAVPDGPQGWTLWTFQPDSPSGGVNEGITDEKLPPNCTRTLSMRVANGGAIAGFQGNREPEEVVAFYNHYFARHNWEVAVPWQRSATGWHARFAAAAEGPADSVDVHLCLDGTGRLNGLLMITPEAIEPTEKENR